MNIVVITDDFPPKKGGIAHTLWNLYIFFESKNIDLYILNPFQENKNIFRRINNTQFKTKDLASFLLKRRFYYLFLSFCLHVSRDRRTSFTDKLHVILYFILKPKILMSLIVNMNKSCFILRKLEYDAFLSAHGGWLLPFTYILSRIFNKKLITMAHGNDFLVQNPLSLKSYFYKNADKIIINSHIMKNLLKKIHHLDPHKIEVINRGIDLNNLEIEKTKEQLRKEFNIPENQYVLLSVGRHITRKDFALVIKAIKQINEKFPDLNIKYYLIGEGEETNNLKNLARTLKIEEKISFLGASDEFKRNKFYKLADVFVMPVKPIKYDLEGFGIVFLEANYYKLPVIGTKTGGVPEAIEDKKTGLLVKPNDLNDLIEKILFLYNNPEIRREMGEIGHERVIEQFTWQKIGNDYLKVLEEILKN